MKKEGLILLVVTFCLMFPLSTLPAEAAGQPPIITSTFYEGTIGWGPVDADPGIASDNASEELLFNTMQGLIAYNGELYWDFVPMLATNVPTLQHVTMTVTNTSAVGADPTGSTWTNVITEFICTGWVDEPPAGFNVGDVVYLTDGSTWRTWTVVDMTVTTEITLHLWRGSYVFNIRTSPTINFYDATGAVVDAFDVGDVKYSMDWYEVTDVAGSPISSSYDKVLFDDRTGHAYWSVPVAGIYPNPMDLAHLIDNAFEVNGNSFTINVGINWSSDNFFKQMLCNTSGCISSKEFDIAHGCWDGDLYGKAEYGGTSPSTIPPGGSRICPPNLPNCPDWYVDWADCPETSDPVDRPLSPLIYCGTGPYHISTIDAVNNKVIMQRNPGFWMGWPAPKCSSYVDVVEIDYIAFPNTRTSAFIAGQLDCCWDPLLTITGIENITFPDGSTFSCWYWVKGWYYNAMYPGNYYYTMWKADDCWFDVNGPTSGVSDGVCNMRDISYLIVHFNAKAPVLGLPVDPKWVGVYGANGCVDPSFPGDRKCNMKDIAGICFQHFNHKANTGTP